MKEEQKILFDYILDSIINYVYEEDAYCRY